MIPKSSDTKSIGIQCILHDFLSVDSSKIEESKVKTLIF